MPKIIFLQINSKDGNISYLCNDILITMNYLNSTIITVAACLLAVVSCQKTNSISRNDKDILFSAGAEGVENSLETKASYAGYVEEISGKKYEPIFWTEGDVISIYCEQVSEPANKFADYRISEVSSTDKTIANIQLNSNSTSIGLRWGDETQGHDFFGVFPGTNVGGICNYISGKTISGSLARSQNTLSGALSGSVSEGYTLAPDMKWMLMHGHAEGLTRDDFPETGKVFIKFQPLTSAIQFTITNSVSNNLVISQLDLISNSTQISGKYIISDVKNTADGFPVVTTGEESITDDQKKVTLDFSSAPVTIAKDKTFTFTFFLLPISDVQDLKFRITRSDGSTMTTRLGYTDGTGIKFYRCKKSFVTGIMVPEGVQWIIDYKPVLIPWNEGSDTPVTLN